MRIIRVKIDPSVKLALKQMAHEFFVRDEGFVYDLFALIRKKGSGIPTRARVQKMVQEIVLREKKGNAVNLGFLMSKRAHVFEQLVKLTFFRALCASKESVDATRLLLINFKKLYLRVRQVQCTACAYMPKCDFGKQYSDTYNDIRVVVDPDWDKKVHADCPFRPDIEGSFQIYESARAMHNMQSAPSEDKKLADAADVPQIQGFSKKTYYASNPIGATNIKPDTDELVPPPESDDELLKGLFIENVSEDDEISQSGYTMGYTRGESDRLLLGQHVCRVHQETINKISAQQLAIFELGMKFSQLLDSTKKGKFAPTSDPSVEKHTRQIESLNDVTKILPAQHALPDEVFDKKLVGKELVKPQNMTFKTKKQLLYLLIDVSGSMSSALGSGKGALKLYTRGTLASSLAIAVTRHVRDDGGIVFCRVFGDMPHDRLEAREKADFETMLDFLAILSYKQGGTNIDRALTQAIHDIQKAKDELAKSEILLITDCADNVTTSRRTLGAIELSTLDVAGANENAEAAAILKTVSNRFYKADEAVVDLSKIVALV